VQCAQRFGIQLDKEKCGDDRSVSFVPIDGGG
jgi:hypothetical protein